MEHSTINQYRKKHRRCRTCKHSQRLVGSSEPLWRCNAKNKGHWGIVTQTQIKGCFCKLYES